MGHGWSGDVLPACHTSHIDSRRGRPRGLHALGDGHDGGPHSPHIDTGGHHRPQGPSMAAPLGTDIASGRSVAIPACWHHGGPPAMLQKACKMRHARYAWRPVCGDAYRHTIEVVQRLLCIVDRREDECELRELDCEEQRERPHEDGWVLHHSGDKRSDDHRQCKPDDPPAQLICVKPVLHLHLSCGSRLQDQGRRGMSCHVACS